MSALPHYIGLVSTSQRVGMDSLSITAAAIQKQVSRDFGPIWEVDATVSVFATLEDVPPDYWCIKIMDNIGAAIGVQGFHRDNQGQPFSLVSADDNWALTASHECLEMLADPFGCRLIACDSPMDGQGRVQVLIEVADPCQSKKCAYTVNGVLVSDFITPNYFDPLASSGVQYSFTGNIKAPLQVFKDGYVSWVDSTTNDWWQMVWYTSDAPTFKKIGPLVPKNGCWRSQIDAMSNGDGNVGPIGGGKGDRGLVAAQSEGDSPLAGHRLEINRRASVARAQSLRNSIDELVRSAGQSFDQPKARPVRRAGGK